MREKQEILNFEEARKVLEEKLNKKIGENKLRNFLKKGMLENEIKSFKNGYEIKVEDVELLSQFLSLKEEELFQIFKERIRNGQPIEKTIYEYEFGDYHTEKYEYLLITKIDEEYHFEAKYGALSSGRISLKNGYSSWSIETSTEENKGEYDRRINEKKLELKELCKQVETRTDDEFTTLKIQDTLCSLYLLTTYSNEKVLTESEVEVKRELTRLEDNFEEDIKICIDNNLLSEFEKQGIISKSEIKETLENEIEQAAEFLPFDDRSVLKNVEIEYKLSSNYSECSDDISLMIKEIKNQNYSIFDDNAGDTDNHFDGSYSVNSYRKIKITFDNEDLEDFVLKMGTTTYFTKENYY